jgi:hypothetical protein
MSATNNSGSADAMTALVAIVFARSGMDETSKKGSHA